MTHENQKDPKLNRDSYFYDPEYERRMGDALKEITDAIDKGMLDDNGPPPTNFREAKMQGRKLTNLRKLQGITLAELAALTGISKGYLCDIENGKHPSVSAEKLFVIAKIFGVSMEFFLLPDDRDTETRMRDNGFFTAYKLLTKSGKVKMQGIVKIIDSSQVEY